VLSFLFSQMKLMFEPLEQCATRNCNIFRKHIISFRIPVSMDACLVHVSVSGV